MVFHTTKIGELVKRNRSLPCHPMNKKKNKTKNYKIYSTEFLLLRSERTHIFDCLTSHLTYVTTKKFSMFTKNNKKK